MMRRHTGGFVGRHRTRPAFTLIELVVTIVVVSIIALLLAILLPSLAGVRRDIPALAELGEAMARPILAGGDLVPAGVAKFWPSEFSQVRGQYRHIRYGEGETANELLFQFLYSIGAHGAHPF